VIDKESRHWPYDGNPRPYEAVRSDGGTASGAYQFINSSWRAYSREAGHPGWSRAYLAPPAVQDDVFYWVVLNKGKYPWKTNGCV
jgi:muramidase (phage lysozyme)